MRAGIIDGVIAPLEVEKGDYLPVDFHLFRLAKS
jgi:hypothetical protein